MQIGQHETHPAADVFPLADGPDRIGLVADIKAHGLLEPIVLCDGKILDGRNRYLACLAAGDQPRFKVFDGDDPVGHVISVNLHRRHLSPSQRAMVAARCLELHKVAAKARQVRVGKSAHTEAEPAPTRKPARRARDEAARDVGGVSGKSVAHAAKVLATAQPEVAKLVERGKLSVDAAAELADCPPEQQAEIVAKVSAQAGEMRRGEVRGLVRHAKKKALAAKIQAEPKPLPGTGPYRVIVADPPWHYDTRADDPTQRGQPDYPTMTTDQICALQIPTPHDDCVLWLWTTNAHILRDAPRVLDAWGFREKTILTWTKPKMGTGKWLRGKTEHCILAVRGNPKVLLTNQTTHLEAPVREHSRKPDEFFELVESLCPGAKVEMFARQARPGWECWGAETGKFAS